MPGIILTVSGQSDHKLSETLAEKISALTCRILQKDIEQTAALIRYHPHEDWFIGGRVLSVLGKNAFKLEVTITDETNTKAEKAVFHREAFALLSEIIGNLHPHSNIHIIDCRASAYGYGGETQEHRFFQSDLKK